MTAATLGQRISELLKQHGWAQAELARRIAIEKSHLSRLMNGERDWQPEQVEKIAKAFGVELAELTSGTDAEGLVAATQSAHEVNAAMGAELAQQRSENEAMQAQLAAVKAECNALQEDLDRQRQKLESALRELRTRPTRQEYDALQKVDDERRTQNGRLRNQLAAAQRAIASGAEQVMRLRAALQKSHAQVLTNYQAYEHWRKQAESSGKALTGVTVAAAGFGLLKLLSSEDED